MYICLHVKYLYSCQILMKLEFSGQVFEKYSYMKFHENMFGESQVVAFGETDKHNEILLIPLKLVHTICIIVSCQLKS